MKKTILCTVLLLGMIPLLFGCSSSSKPRLSVFNWGDYIDESVLDQFEKENNVDVVYSTFDQNEDMYTKIKTSPGSYDVVIPSDYMIQKMIKEGMLAKIDLDNIPNFSLIDEKFTNLSFDPGNQYSIPYMWGTMGIIYNKTMVDKPIDSWSALWDKKYSGQIFMMNSVRDSMGIALTSLGYSMNTRDKDELNKAKDTLIAQKPLILAYTGDEIKDKMIAGEGALAVVYSGDAITMIGENPDLEYVIPKEGSNKWFDNACILADSKNKALAEKFINFLCRTDIAAKNRDYINYSSPQKEVVAQLPDEIKNDKRQYPDDQTLSRCIIYEDLGDLVSYYEEIWLQVVVK